MAIQLNTRNPPRIEAQLTDPMAVAVAAALAGSTAGAAFQVVREKLTSRRASKLLAKALTNHKLNDREISALTKELSAAAAADPLFAAALRQAWESDQARQPDLSGTTNQVRDSVVRSVVQARDVKGDITLE